jgi:hypothetical protein
VPAYSDGDGRLVLRRAGTLGDPGADPNIAADNTTKLVKFYASHPGAHTHTEIQNLFTQDIVLGQLPGARQ